MEWTEGIIIALIGAGGAVVGSAATLAGQWLAHHLNGLEAARRDAPRKALLQAMLAGGEWRRLDTLSHVIGTDPEVTKDLLLQIGARASETSTDVWALVSEKPLPTTQ